MNAQILAMLRGGTFTLTSNNLAIGDLDWVFPETLAPHKRLVLTGAKVDGDGWAIIGTLDLEGATSDARIEFGFADGVLIRYALMIMVEDGWSPVTIFPDLPAFFGPALMIEDLPLRVPCLVFASAALTLDVDDYGLSGVDVEAGVSIYASELGQPIDPDDLGMAAFAGLLDRPLGAPESVMISLNRTSMGLNAVVTLWWPENGDAGTTIAGARIKRTGWQMSAFPLETMTPAVQCAWLWQVDAHAGAENVLLNATIPSEEGRSPSYRAQFDHVMPLISKGGAITPLTAGVNPIPLLPFSDHVTIGLRSVDFSPGEYMAADLSVRDRITGQPYRWDAIPDLLTISDIDVSISAVLTPQTHTRVAISGTVNVAGIPFDVTGDVDVTKTPHLQSVDGSLASAQGLDLNAIIRDLFGDGISIPAPHLTLESARYSQDFANDARIVALGLGGDVDLFGNGLVNITELGAEVRTLGGEADAISVYGGLTLGGVPLHLRASHDADEGWHYTGRAIEGHSVSLKDMAADMTARIGASEPAFLPDVTLTDLGVSYVQNTKEFTVFATTHWTLPDTDLVPWGGEDLATSVALSCLIDPATGNRRTDATIAWDIETKSGHSFLASAAFSGDTTTYHLDWNVNQTGDTLGLASLSQSFSLGEVFTLPSIADWPIFNFTALSVAYESNPRLIQLSASSRLGKGALDMSLAFSDDERSLHAGWVADDSVNGSIGLPDLLDLAGLTHVIDLPGDLGADLFTFHQLSLTYRQGKSNDISFSGAAKGAPAENLFLTLHRAPDAMGFVAGYAFSELGRLTELTGLGSIKGLDTVEEFLSLKMEYLLVSTVTMSDFMPPIGGLSGEQQAHRMTPGVSFAGRVVMKGSSNVAFNFISDLIYIDELDASVTLGKAGVALTAAIPGDVSLPVIPGGELRLTDPYFGVASTGAVPSFSIGGGIHMMILDHPFYIDAKLNVIETGANLTAHLEGFPIPPYHAFPGVHFDDVFDLELGIQFEPPGLNMGFAGTFWIGEKSDHIVGDVTIVMELVEGVPQPEFVRFSISKLSFWGIFEAMTGTMTTIKGLQDGIDAVGGKHGAKSGAVSDLQEAYHNLSFIFDTVEMEHVAFHWCDSIVTLPDGSVANPGVGFKGELTLFGFPLYGAFDFATGTSTHFTAHLEMEAVNINGILSITGDGKGLRKAEVETESERRARKGRVLTDTENTYVLKSGGPVFIVSSQHQPFLHADIHVRLFEVIHLDLTADIDSHKMKFDLAAVVSDLVHIDLTCCLSYDGPPSFYAHGHVDIHLDAGFYVGVKPIGLAVDLNTGFDADVTISFSEDGDFLFEVDGSFEFMGTTLHLPFPLKIEERFHSLDDLPNMLIRFIEDNALKIFEEILKDPGKLVKAGIDFAEKRIDYMNKTATKGIHTGLDAADKGLRGTEVAVHEAQKELSHDLDLARAATDKEISTARKETKETINTIDKGTNTELRKAEDTVNKLSFGLADHIPGLKHAASDLVHGGMKVVGDVTDYAEKKAAQIIDTGLKAGKHLLEAAEKYYHKMVDIAEGLLKTAGLVVDWVSGGVSYIADGVGKLSKKIVDGVGDAVDEVRNFLGF
ncbi:MAG: hypothetical protein ACI9ND_001110 [Yoonia sp.]|jgi:hypothetical protein